jgi:hypothetical protein
MPRCFRSGSSLPIAANPHNYTTLNRLDNFATHAVRLAVDVQFSNVDICAE